MIPLTKDRKIKVNKTVYIFRVPIDTSLDPVDIIKAGIVQWIKVGAMPGVDVFGNPVSPNWNVIKPIEIEESHQLRSFINNAIEHTKNLIKAEEQNPGTKLPRLTTMKHQKKIIEREDEPKPRYFIRAISYCANCHEEIEGTQTLLINNNGKVGKEEPFQPNDKACTQCPNSKKWLHVECQAKHITPENVTLKDVVKAGREAGMRFEFDLEKKQSPKEILLELLIEPTVNSEFVRGAAYMFLLMNKGE